MSARAHARDAAKQRAAVAVLRALDPDVVVDPFTRSGEFHVARFEFNGSGNRVIGRDVEARVGNGAYVSVATACTSDSSGLHLWLPRQTVRDFARARAALSAVAAAFVVVGFVGLTLSFAFM